MKSALVQLVLAIATALLIVILWLTAATGFLALFDDVGDPEGWLLIGIAGAALAGVYGCFRQLRRFS